MNIMIVPSWYESDSNRIRGSFFKEQAIALHKSGHNVVIAYVYLRTTKELVNKNMFRIVRNECDGIITYVYHFPSLGSFRRNNWFEKYVSCYRKLLKYILKKEKIDIIHAHSFIPAGYAMCILKKEFHIPVCLTEHFSGIIVHNLEPRQEQALKYTLEQADGIAAVSNALCTAMENYNYARRKIHMIPNMVSPIFTYKITSKKKEVPFCFVSIGGLIQSKRHNITIDAFHQAFPLTEEVKLFIIGEGPERNSLKSKINELGESQRIFLVGRKGRKEVAELLQKMDAFVLPSAHETFGVAYVEAMASGLPVIGTKNGGFEEIFAEEYGYICKVDDVDGLASSMQVARLEISKFNKKAISQYALEQFGEDNLIRLLDEWYKEVLAQLGKD